MVLESHTLHIRLVRSLRRVLVSLRRSSIMRFEVDLAGPRAITDQNKVLRFVTFF
jgi:hypothetical protein